MADELRHSGIPLIGDVSWGEHFCVFYDTTQDLLDLLVPYFKAGLENHECCLWVIAEPLSTSAATEALARAVPDLERRLSEHSIEIVTAAEWYLTHDNFEMQRVLTGWEEKLARALARGYAGLRASGSTAWLRATDKQDFGAYEKQLNDTVANRRILLLCTYCLANTSAAEILDVARCHQQSLALRRGAWEVIETPEIREARAEIERLNADLERRVAERTRELAASNADLKREIDERKRAEDALRASEDHFRMVINTIPVMAWSLRTDGIVDFVNQRWMDYTGLSLEQYRAEPGRPIHPADIPRVFARWAADSAAGKPSEDEMRLQGADGLYRWFLVRTDPLRDESGAIVKWYGVSTEIDDRKRAEEELNRHAARAETLVRIAARLNRQLDLDAVIRDVCQELIDTFKASQATMSLYDPQRDQLVYAGGVNIPPQFAAAIEPIGRSRFDELRRELGPIMVVPDIQAMPDVPNREFSTVLDVRTVVTAAMLRDSELIGVLVFGVNGHVREFDKDELSLLKAIGDQAAQAVANALLLKAANEQHAQLRALSARLVEAQEAERRAVARELHDEIGQALTGLHYMLDAAGSQPPAAAQARLREAGELIQELIGRVRELSLDLRPSMLDDQGLLPALRWLFERYTQRTQIEVAFTADGLGRRFAPQLETTVFRIVQEALTNTARHAAVGCVTVHAAADSRAISVDIADTGEGFDPNAALADHRTMGLNGMLERARLAGGQLTISAAPGAGTRLRLSLPLPAQSASAP